MAYRILIVDDEPILTELLSAHLQDHGYTVSVANSSDEALAKLNTKPNLILLDINMPGMDGLELCKVIRNHIVCPILFLTARITEQDKVNGLRAGGDDYITKPFAIEELLARIRAALRNKGGPANVPLAVGPLVMDVEKHQVTVRGQSVELTKKEFDLLHHLLENKNRVLSREALLDAVWGFDFVGETNSVDVYIRFLRSKLDDAFGLKLIHTVRGVGYVIKEE